MPFWNITLMTCAWALIKLFFCSFSSSFFKSRVYLKRLDALSTSAACCARVKLQFRCLAKEDYYTNVPCQNWTIKTHNPVIKIRILTTSFLKALIKESRLRKCLLWYKILHAFIIWNVNVIHLNNKNNSLASRFYFLTNTFMTVSVVK